jgi:aryl-alcohol dehydrogenase-like predicted oxidoreductase
MTGTGTMKTRTIGSGVPGGGLAVSAIGLGCMVMPGFYGAGSEEESLATLRRAGDIGMTFLDTSDLYGFGKNEELIARAIAGRRADYVIATKFGNVRDRDGKPAVNGRPEYVRQACDASLKRLGIDVIDLYYQHRVDPAVPIEDTVGAMAGLVAAGKVRFLGLSEAAPDTVRRAHRVHPIAALQSEYSLWTRDDEDDLLPLCAELGIGYVAYSPLGRGMFGGGVTGEESIGEGDRRRSHPRFQGENLKSNLKLLEPVQRIAEARGAGCSAAQVALAWLLAQGGHIVPIPGTRRISHLESNAAAADLDLTANEIAAIDRAVPRGAAKGERYPADAMKLVRG